MNPEELHALCERAVARLGKGDPSLANQARRELARADKKAAWPLALRSQLSRAEGNLERCLADLEAAARREPLPWVYRLEAECLDQLGRMEDALAALDKGLSLAPGDVGLLAFKGHALFHRKQYENAAKTYTLALKAAPRDASLFAARADCWRLFGRPDRARKDLARVAELDPRPRGEAEKIFDEGSRALRAGKYEKAARLFSRVDAGFSRLARGLGFMRRHRGKLLKGKKTTLILTGLGLDYPHQATLEVLKVLSECDIVVDNLAGAEALDFLRLFCDDVRAISFEGVTSTAWADKIFSWLKPGKKVAFVTRGHPLVSGHLALTLLQRARKKKIAVECYGAISSVDQILALSHEVLGETFWGVQALDSQLLLAGSLVPETRLPAILYLNSRPGDPTPRPAIEKIGALLVKTYGAAHKARVYGPRYDSRVLDEVPLGRLEAFLAKVRPNMFSSLILYIPPLENLVPVRRGGDDGAWL